MATVPAEIRFAPQLTAWFAANPTKVLQDGEIVYCSDGANIGKYVIGDNSTQLSALTFYGGVSSGGLTVGTTAIASGTNTRILYNNNGVLGEYSVTGSGTTAVLSTSPTFIDGIGIGASPSHSLEIQSSSTSSLGSAVAYTYYSGAGSGAAQFFISRARGTSGSPTALNSADDIGFLSFRGYNGSAFTGTRAALSSETSEAWTTIANGTQINLSVTANGTTSLFDAVRVLNNGNLQILNSSAFLYMGSSAPTSNNYAISKDASTTIINSTSALILKTGDNSYSNITINSTNTGFTCNTVATGAITNFTFTSVANTNQTLNTNIPNFKVVGSSKQKATGADSLQYYNWFTSNTSTYVGASTLTLGANTVFEYMQGGTNSTVTTSCAILVPTLVLTNTTTSYGMLLNAASGAATNYALGCIGNFTVTGSGYISGNLQVDGTFVSVTSQINTIYPRSDVDLSIGTRNGVGAKSILFKTIGVTPTESWRIDQNGNLTSTVGTATANIHLKAGTATANTAPLKFTSGTNNTTAEAGAMEYNGTNLFFTRSGTTREGVLTQSAVTTEVVVSDTTITVNIGGVTYKLLARA